MTVIRPESGPLLVACLQLDGRDAPASARRAAAVEAIDDAAAECSKRTQGARLIVLPELWPVGFFHFDDYAGGAETLTGPTVTALADAARRHRCWIYGGSFVERGSAGAPHLYNTGVLLDPDGRTQLVYRKNHLFGYRSREAEILSPGVDAGTAPTPFGTLGATTCFDLRFPEIYRDLVDGGATVLVVASAWPAARLEHWRVLLRARAIESQAYVIACDAAGTDNGVALAGHSMVIDPWGTVVAEAGEAPTTLFSSIDPAAPATIRAEYPFLAARQYRVDRRR